MLDKNIERCSFCGKTIDQTNYQFKRSNNAKIICDDCLDMCVEILEDEGMEVFPQKDQKGITCSFCGCSKHTVAKLITGPNGVLICDTCIRWMKMFANNELMYYTSSTLAKPELVPTTERHDDIDEGSGLNLDEKDMQDIFGDIFGDLFHSSTEPSETKDMEAQPKEEKTPQSKDMMKGTEDLDDDFFDQFDDMF